MGKVSEKLNLRSEGQFQSQPWRHGDYFSLFQIHCAM
jgi:hypothetical protein